MRQWNAFERDYNSQVLVIQVYDTYIKVDN